MSKVATMLIRCNGKRYEIGEELPDKVVAKLGEDHTAVGDPPRKKKKADDKEADDKKKKKADDEGNDTKKKKKKGK